MKLFSRLLFLGLLAQVYCRVGFKKKLDTDMPFPPKVQKIGDGIIPTGHLRPLGFQRTPEAEVDSIKKDPEPTEFYRKYVRTNTPVVLRQIMKDAPARTLWEKDDYLKKTYGELDIHVVVKKELLHTGPKKMKFKKFLREYQYEDWYLSNIVPSEMMKDLQLPRCLRCGMRKLLVESELWMSSGGTTSLVHNHPDHDLHCLLDGRKDFILIDQKYKPQLHFKEKKPNIGSGYSPLDVDQVNMFKNAEIADIPWKWATLRPGDCMFVPAGILHQVRSFGRSISSTMLWAPVPKVDSGDCSPAILKEVPTLDSVGFMWSYRHALRHLTDTSLKGETLRHHLILLMRDFKTLPYRVFKHFYDEVMSEIKEFEDAKEVWPILDTSGKRALMRNELMGLDVGRLQKVANIINKAHEGHAKKPSGMKHDEL